jgi:2-keto-4-pentenoate hydratase/2-oxohepta-3-ene-1,7-dioic acid hydratase in catechol pathway
LVSIGSDWFSVKLVTFSTGREDRVGVVVVDGDRAMVRDVTPLLPPATGMLGVIEGWDVLEPVLHDGTLIPLDSVDLLAPIPVPRRNIFCVGKNYRDHAAEFGRSGYDSPSRSEELPDRPIVFSKATTSVVGPGARIDPHPGVTRELDYEGVTRRTTTCGATRSSTT